VADIARQLDKKLPTTERLVKELQTLLGDNSAPAQGA
jgi:hypothetical protein